MASRKFTEEEINSLKANPYVLHVSPSLVHYSAEFKEKFWDGVLARKDPREIVTELGFDPDLLGAYRLNGLKAMIRNEVRAGKGFRDLKTYGAYRDENANPEARIKHLEQQLA